MSDGFTGEELAQQRGSANEPNWDAFVNKVGGYKVSDRYPQADFENADYVFPDQKVVIELKIIENEIDKTDQFREKMNALSARLFEKHKKTPLALDPKVTAQYLKGFIGLFRSPIARIGKKANSQIKTTKSTLGLEDYQGVWLLVNDNLRELAPEPMLHTLGRILNGSYSSINACIYLTNHYVIVPGDEYGRILWAPLYQAKKTGQLRDFVNWLGRE
ncbi:hypothetical protein [Qipengyuania sp. NPDC077563]|uniref:hypothetical protein n=1 Tax=Qipengyuania sp. NPDC077563 TaxID=3364497 RepID=UPI0038509CFA